jgi:hypothetical protein
VRDSWGAPTKGWPSFGPDGRRVDDDAPAAEPEPEEEPVDDSEADPA